MAEELWQRSNGRGAVTEEQWQRSSGREAMAGEPWQSCSGRGAVAEEHWQNCILLDADTLQDLIKRTRAQYVLTDGARHLLESAIPQKSPFATIFYLLEFVTGRN